MPFWDVRDCPTGISFGHKFGVYAGKVTCLTPGDLPVVGNSEYSKANWASTV